MGSVVKTAVRNVACNLAKPASNLLTYYRTDSVQTGSHDTFLSRFALFYGMTIWWDLLDTNKLYAEHLFQQKIRKPQHCAVAFAFLDAGNYFTTFMVSLMLLPTTLMK